MSGSGPVLTPSQRKWLHRVDSIDFEDADERTLRSRLRSRIRAAISDFSEIYENLPEEDRRQLFEIPKSGDAKDRLSEVTDFTTGISSLLALLYEATEAAPGRDFEEHVENAMHRIAERNDWVLDEFELNIKFKKAPDLDHWEARFDGGEATIQEATILLQRGRVTSEEFTAYVESHLGGS